MLSTLLPAVLPQVHEASVHDCTADCWHMHTAGLQISRARRHSRTLLCVRQHGRRTAYALCSMMAWTVGPVTAQVPSLQVKHSRLARSLQSPQEPATEVLLPECTQEAAHSYAVAMTPAHTC